MEVKFAFWAEAIQFTTDGRLNILGVDLREVRGTFPLSVPGLGLVIKLALNREDVHPRYHVRFELSGPGGELLGPALEQEVVPAAISPPGEAQLVIALFFGANVLPTPGTYTARIAIGNWPLITLPLRAVDASVTPAVQATTE